MKENETAEAIKPSDKKAGLVTGMFNDRDSAVAAYSVLEKKGYGKEHIHVIMSDETHKKHFSDDKHAANFDTHNSTRPEGLDHKTKEGAETGAAIGIGLGAMIGAIATLGTSILLPGVGLLIAGPFVAGILAAGAGGIAGGVFGALVGAGIPEEHAKKYEHGIKNGHIVLGVNPLNEQDAIYIESEWKKHKGSEINRG